MSILKAEGLAKSVHTTEGPLSILSAVDLEVNRGQSVAILGASGSGKTTLLGLLAGLDTPSSGDVLIEGQSISKMDESQRAAFRLGRIGFVFQNFELLPHLNALDNVLLPLELSGQPKALETGSMLLKQLGLEKRQHHFPTQLSGGEQQRVALARAFAIKPSILFADEPTGSLDEQTSQNIIKAIFELNQQFNTTLLFVTHDPMLAEKCNELYVLKEGQLKFKDNQH